MRKSLLGVTSGIRAPWVPRTLWSLALRAYDLPPPSLSGGHRAKGSPAREKDEVDRMGWTSWDGQKGPPSREG